MNVTKPFIYTHFKSKNELLAEICSRGIRASLNVLDSVVASEGSATEKLRVFAHEFMLAVIENQSHIAIYTREEKNLALESKKAIQKMRREFDRKFCVLLEQGVTDGEFQVADVQLTALSIGGLISWSYVWYRPDGRLSKKETADHVAELVLAMVKTKR
jgi:AcrR family transcriptional regulator